MLQFVTSEIKIISPKSLSGRQKQLYYFGEILEKLAQTILDEG